jgi:hypothetical protein
MQSCLRYALLVVAVATMSCGEERVDLTPLLAGAEAGVDCSVLLPPACAPDGTPCTSVSSCCSNRCERGYCVQSGTCSAPGSPCTTRSTCCSGRCESSQGDLICAGYCRPDGAHCDTPLDCCTPGCNAGRCGGAICKVVGTACGSDGECCSLSCDNGQCALDSSTVCRNSGEGCPAVDAGMACCSGVCNQSTQRCDIGPGPCRAPGVLCIVDADCCRGHCTLLPSGVSECNAPCLPDGADCNSAGDCCSSVCSGSPAKCGGDHASCSG